MTIKNGVKILNTRAIGANLEELTSDYLKDKGVEIVERNYRCRQGEIDIIGRDGKYLCFMEVKFRSSDRYGNGLDAVDFKKQKKICSVAKFYLYSKYKSFDIPVRMDVIAISLNGDIYEFNWIKNAFDFVE